MLSGAAPGEAAAWLRLTEGWKRPKDFAGGGFAMGRKVMVVLVGWLLVGLGVVSCGKSPTGTEGKSAEELLKEGWTAFEAGKYKEAVEKFEGVVEKDASLWDGYNGLGWSKGRLGETGDAVTAFLNALGGNEGLLSARAGLAFAYNAQGKYEKSNEQAEEVLEANGEWAFAHDSRVDWRDLVVLEAENWFALGEYGKSLAAVRRLNEDFTVEVGTVEGQAALAAEIERLVDLEGRR